MSDTPRTDMFCRTVEHTAFIGGNAYKATIETVDASFARQLETELAEARAEIERKDKLIEQMKTAMEAALKNLKMQGGSRIVIEDIETALSATESGEIITLCRNCKGDKR